MTDLNGNYFTVKNVTATTLELYTPQTAATTVVNLLMVLLYSIGHLAVLLVIQLLF
jgi:hypothetical protein